MGGGAASSSSSSFSPVSSSGAPMYDMSSKERFTNGILTFHHFSYYMLHAPFRFHRNEPSISGCPWGLVKHRLHQFLWLVASLVGNVTLRAKRIWECFQALRLAPQNAKLYFNFLSVCVLLGSEIAAQHLYWFGGMELLEIVNFLGSNAHLFPEQGGSLHRFVIRSHWKTFPRLLCVLATMLTVNQFLVNDIFDVTSVGHPPSWYWSDPLFEQLDTLSQEFRNDSSSNGREDQGWERLSLWMSLAHIPVKLHRTMVGFYFDLSLLIVALNVWTVTGTFIKALKRDMTLTSSSSSSSPFKGKSPSSLQSASGEGLSTAGKLRPVKDPSVPSPRPGKLTWTQVHDMYGVVKGLCQRVNASYGSLFMLHLAGSILFHSVDMDQILEYGNLRQLFFLLQAVLIFCLAAEVIHQMSQLRDWMELEVNRRKIPEQEYQSVMSDLKGNAVGIRAGDRFTITYAVLWNALATVVTYFIICLQSRQMASSKT